LTARVTFSRHDPGSDGEGLASQAARCFDREISEAINQETKKVIAPIMSAIMNTFVSKPLRKAVFAPTVTTRLLHQVLNPSRAALSARELEVLMLVAGGASNKMIARALHLSEATVKSHLLHLFAKLAVSDRTAAVTAVLERGLLHLDS
jgi:DNA-binding NarL/FixJ family response regulator